MDHETRLFTADLPNRAQNSLRECLRSVYACMFGPAMPSLGPSTNCNPRYAECPPFMAPQTSTMKLVCSATRGNRVTACRRTRRSFHLCILLAVNIHSHLWGAVLFVFILFTFNANHVSRYELSAGWLDLGVFTVFLSSAVFCLSASAFYHTVGSHSDAVGFPRSPPLLGPLIWTSAHDGMQVGRENRD